MPVIAIDITGELPVVGFDEDLARAKIMALAEMARSEWVRQAQQNLGSSAEDYISGIQPVENKGNWVVVRLVGALPNAIENGKAPFDMKPGLLSGPHAKNTNKGVKFNTVPFRHGVPGTTGKRVGAPMPFTHKTKAGNPTSFIYTAAKKLKVSSEDATGKTVWGGRTGDLGGYGARSQLPVKGGRPGAYTWKSSPYAGMVKIAKTYAKATQHQYVTFRRVSSNSDPNSWWHPGIQARRFVNVVANYIRSQIARL